MRSLLERDGVLAVLEGERGAPVEARAGGRGQGEGEGDEHRVLHDDCRKGMGRSTLEARECGYREADTGSLYKLSRRTQNTIPDRFKEESVWEKS